jgi:hypothetical protein
MDMFIFSVMLLGRRCGRDSGTEARLIVLFERLKVGCGGDWADGDAMEPRRRLWFSNEGEMEYLLLSPSKLESKNGSGGSGWLHLPLGIAVFVLGFERLFSS